MAHRAPVTWPSCDCHLTIVQYPCDCHVIQHLLFLHTALQHQRLALGIVQQLPHILRPAFSSWLVYHHLDVGGTPSWNTQEATASHLLQRIVNMHMTLECNQCLPTLSHPITLYNTLYCIYTIGGTVFALPWMSFNSENCAPQNFGSVWSLWHRWWHRQRSYRQRSLGCMTKYMYVGTTTAVLLHHL